MNGTRKALALLATVSLVGSATVLAAKHTKPQVVVVRQRAPSGSSQPPAPGGRRVAAPGVTNISGTESPSAATQSCQGPTPGPSWTCEAGKWTMTSGVAATSAASGGGRIDRANGCLTEQPGPGLTCQGGLWTLGTAEPAAVRPAATTKPVTTTDGQTACAEPKPGSAWTCESGTWMLPATPTAPVLEPTPSPRSADSPPEPASSAPGPVMPVISAEPTAPASGPTARVN
jgi:hypothetical protein